jgi:hypothetical protein
MTMRRTLLTVLTLGLVLAFGAKSSTVSYLPSPLSGFLLALYTGS